MMNRATPALLLFLLLASCGTLQDPELAVSPTTPEETTSATATSADSSLPSDQTTPQEVPPPTFSHETEPKPAPPSSLPGASPPITGFTPTEVPEGLESVVDLAMADLASRLGVPPSDIMVVSVEEVTWRDGSLGCPQPGMAYTQALVNGTRIRLASAGVVYEYHSGGAQDPFFCATPEEPLSSGLGDS